MHVVVGIGDGELIRDLSRRGEAVAALALQDEELQGDGVFLRVRDLDDVDSAAYALFGGHRAALELAAATFHRSHPVNGQSAFREQVVDRLFATIEHIPYLWGNCMVDSMQGLVHAAQNACALLPASDWTCFHAGETPVVAVGAGPSLRDCLDDLAAIQDSVVIVSCDAAVPVLHEAGIDPMLVTPLERLRSTAQKLQGSVAPISTFAGLPVVPPEAVAEFRDHLYISAPDMIYQWLGHCTAPLLPGSTTGTLAVALAHRITHGPVYLVGHDLCYDAGRSHCAGSPSDQWHHGDVPVRVPGNDGQDQQATIEWARFRLELGDMCRSERTVNVAAHLRKGAVIPGTQPGPLPTGGRISYTQELRPNPDRYRAWRERAMYIHQDAVEFCGNLVQSTSLDQLQVDELIGARNADALAYLYRPVFAQFSVEKRLGRDPALILAAIKEAVSNSFRELEPFFGQVRDAAA